MATTENLFGHFLENREIIKRVFRALFPEGWIEVSVLQRGEYDEEKHEFKVKGRYSGYFNLSKRGGITGFINKVESILRYEINKGTLRGLYFGMQPRKKNLLNKASGENNILGIYNIVLDIDYYHSPTNNERLERFGLTDKMKFELSDLAGSAVSAFKKVGIQPVYVLLTGRGIQIAFRLEKPIKENVSTEVLRAIAYKLERILREDMEFSRKFSHVALDYNAIKLSQIVRFPLTPNGATKRLIQTEFFFVAEHPEKAVLPEEFVSEALTAMKQTQTNTNAQGSGAEVMVNSKPVKLSEFKVRLSEEHKRKIAEIFAELYEKGTHNDLALALAGFLAWRRVNIQDALETVDLFLKITRDSENSGIIEKELEGILLRAGRRAVEKVYYTYRRMVSGEKISWKTLLEGVLRTKVVKEASSPKEIDDLVSKRLTQVTMSLNRALPIKRIKHKNNNSPTFSTYENLTDSEMEIFETFSKFIDILAGYSKRPNKGMLNKIASFEFGLFDRVQENLVRTIIYVKQTVNGTSRKYSLELLDKDLNVHEVTFNNLSTPFQVLSAIENIRREYLIPPESWIRDKIAKALKLKNEEYATIVASEVYGKTVNLFYEILKIKLTRELENFKHDIRDSWEFVRIQTEEELAEELLFSILSDAHTLIVKSDEVYYPDWIYLTNKGELLIPASIVKENLSLNHVSGKTFVSVLRKRKLFINNTPRKYRTTRKVKMIEEMLKDFAGDVNISSSAAAQETFYRLNANAVFEFISETFNEDLHKKVISLDEALSTVKLFEITEKLKENVEQQLNSKDSKEEEEVSPVLEIHVGGDSQ